MPGQSSDDRRWQGDLDLTVLLSIPEDLVARVDRRSSVAVRLSKLAKRDVVAMAEGRTLGPPHAILIDPDRHRVGVIVMVASPVRELTVVARASSIKSFESDTIAVDGLTSLRIAAHDEMALDLLAGRVVFREREALSSQGHRLGTIRDVLIEADGRVSEYWIRKRRLGFLRPKLKIHPEDLSASPGGVAVVSQASHEEVATDAEGSGRA